LESYTRASGLICANASNEDGDDLEALLAVPESCTASHVDTGSKSAGCFVLECTEPGRVDLTLTVFDLMRDGRRFEDVLALQGYPSPSRAELSFFVQVTGTRLWPDADGHGFGDSSAAPVLACEAEEAPGLSQSGSDCDDAAASIHGGALEVCANAVDDNCDGQIDEGGD
jgi:hypothetical protein